MSSFGFSWIGALYLIALFVPNILWARNKPESYDKLASHEAPWMVWCERIGEVLTCTCAAIFAETNPHAPIDVWTSWLVFSVSCMFLYLASWRIYFTSTEKLEAMYAPVMGIPVPLASLPVAAFLLLGIYGHAWPLVAATVILGIGHIGIHVCHAKELGLSLR
ncbi:MAG: hypothetical protein IKE43_08790 [Coriobacteriales bacterium]|nr:hypothetical protein [Coriobacteriales bacterium]